MRIKRSLSAIIATIFIAAVPLAASAQFSVGVGFTIGTPPPALPTYTMPAAPYPNYLWQPGYWAWGPAGYYWVPGTWVAPPSVGVYWTPGYWGYNNGYYGWNAGYWGPTVGFYGGINYGFGYFGTGFSGGYWSGGRFNYNTAVMNVNRTVIHNTYNRTIINRNVCNNCRNVSYNGGHGGINARPTAAQIDARRDGIAPTTAQRDQARVASENRNLYANVNHGRPATTAVQKPVTDPRNFRDYSPVTSADKTTAHGQVNHAATHGAPATTTHRYEPMHRQTSGSMNATHPQGGAGHPGGSMQAHPNGQAHPSEGKPPSGNDQQKPPRR